MVCLLCNSKDFMKIDHGSDGIYYKCFNCGSIWLQYDDNEAIELIDFDKQILHNYILNLIDEKIKDENRKNFVKGQYMCYLDAIYSNKKKVKEWGLYKIADLITALQKL